MSGGIGWGGARRAIRAAAAAAVNAQADLGAERTRERAPKETHELEESIFVEHATEADLTAQIGTDVEYARYQHEALYLEHPDGGQPKYMESAVIGGDSRNRLTRAAVDAFQRTLPG